MWLKFMLGLSFLIHAPFALAADYTMDDFVQDFQELSVEVYTFNQKDLDARALIEVKTFLQGIEKKVLAIEEAVKNSKALDLLERAQIYSSLGEASFYQYHRFITDSMPDPEKDFLKRDLNEFVKRYYREHDGQSGWWETISSFFSHEIVKVSLTVGASVIVTLLMQKFFFGKDGSFELSAETPLSDFFSWMKFGSIFPYDGK